jgi:hypothetical protein
MTFESIPDVRDNNLREVCEKLRRNVEILTGARPKQDIGNRAVLVRDLVDSGTIQLTRANRITPPSALGNAVDVIDSGSINNSAQYDSPRFTSDYRSYAFYFDGLLPATDNVELWLRLFNETGVLSGASDYAHARQSVSSAASAAQVGDQADSEIEISGVIGNTSVDHVNGVITIYNPSFTGIRTAVNWVISFNTEANVFRSTVGGGQRLASEFNNAMRILFSSGNIAAMNYTLYGYRAK